MSDTKTRKILMLLKIPPPYGGGEILCAQLRDHMQLLPDFITQVITSEKRNKTTQNRFAWWKLREFFQIWYALVRNFRKHRPMLFFLPMAKTFPSFFRDSIYIWTAWLLRIRVALELPGATFYFLGKNRFKTSYGRWILNHVSCLRVLGDSVAYTLAGHGIKNMIITDNGVPEAPGNQSDQTLPADEISLLFVGTHSPEKGFDDFVKAVVALKERSYRITVHTMGRWISPEFKFSMLQILESSDLLEHFTFHGLIHDAVKWSVFEKSQVLVLPSLAEGQPLVILEAYAAGLAVVATDVGGIPDCLIDGINGFLIKPHDIPALTDALENLLNDDKTRRTMAENNRALHLERFTLHDFLDTQTAWLRACAAGTLNLHGLPFFNVNTFRSNLD